MEEKQKHKGRVFLLVGVIIAVFVVFALRTFRRGTATGICQPFSARVLRRAAPAHRHRPRAYHAVSYTHLLADVARIAGIRKAVGSGIQIRVDANQGWTAKEAIRIITDVYKRQDTVREVRMRYGTRVRS